MIFAGLSMAAAPGVFAQSYYGYDRDRDLRHDYRREQALMNDIARDRARLNEDIRCGRQGAAARDAADLARDQRALESLRRDVRFDQYARGYRRY
jgi:hypothetical protein